MKKTLKKLKRKEETSWHLDEEKKNIFTIIGIFAKRGYLITPEDACWAWERYSDCCSAGWLGLPSDDEVFDYAMEYMVETE